MKMTTFFSTRTILSENGCHFVNLLKVDILCKSFFSQLDINHMIYPMECPRTTGFFKFINRSTPFLQKCRFSIIQDLF